jgi:hypothetical protein
MKVTVYLNEYIKINRQEHETCIFGRTISLEEFYFIVFGLTKNYFSEISFVRKIGRKEIQYS